MDLVAFILGCLPCRWWSPPARASELRQAVGPPSAVFFGHAGRNAFGLICTPTSTLVARAPPACALSPTDRSGKKSREPAPSIIATAIARPVFRDYWA